MPGKVSVLHFAPERILTAQLVQHSRVEYLSADISGKAMVKVDITKTPWSSGSFRVILCSHVLEHVVDDRQAMRELHRILDPDGVIILQVPLSSGLTIEDPTITDPNERERRFGQRDHVRQYGEDFDSRLRDAGFVVERVVAEERLPRTDLQRYGVGDREVLFLSRKGQRGSSVHFS